jgi:hypothetical protein
MSVFRKWQLILNKGNYMKNGLMNVPTLISNGLGVLAVVVLTGLTPSAEAIGPNDPTGFVLTRFGNIHFLEALNIPAKIEVKTSGGGPCGGENGSCTSPQRYTEVTKTIGDVDQVGLRCLSITEEPEVAGCDFTASVENEIRGNTCATDHYDWTSKMADPNNLVADMLENTTGSTSYSYTRSFFDGSQSKDVINCDRASQSCTVTAKQCETNVPICDQALTAIQSHAAQDKIDYLYHACRDAAGN